MSSSASHARRRRAGKQDRRVGERKASLNGGWMARALGAGFPARKLGPLALGVALTAGLSAPAHAQFKTPQDAVKYRGSTMVLLGAHFGRLAPVAKKEVSFDQAAVQANVDVVRMLASLPWAAYAPGYEGGEARSSVWTNREGFRKAGEDFQAAVLQLDDATQAGDFNAFRVAFGKVGQSCKACHDSFRVKK